MYSLVNKRNGLPVILFILFFSLGVGSLVPEEAPLDRTDPEAVAKFVLAAIQYDDLQALVEVMDKDQSRDFIPFTPQSRSALEAIVKKDKEKLGKKAKITELRQCTALSGKPGVAAQAGKKEDEIYVIILSKEGDIYSYENILTVFKDTYQDLVLIKKVK
jgi:hypothetical protein